MLAVVADSQASYQEAFDIAVSCILVVFGKLYYQDEIGIQISNFISERKNATNSSYSIGPST